MCLKGFHPRLRIKEIFLVQRSKLLGYHDRFFDKHFRSQLVYAGICKAAPWSTPLGTRPEGAYESRSDSINSWAGYADRVTLVVKRGKPLFTICY